MAVHGIAARLGFGCWPRRLYELHGAPETEWFFVSGFNRGEHGAAIGRGSGWDLGFYHGWHGWHGWRRDGGGVGFFTVLYGWNGVDGLFDGGRSGWDFGGNRGGLRGRRGRGGIGGRDGGRGQWGSLFFTVLYG